MYIKVERTCLLDQKDDSLKQHRYSFNLHMSIQYFLNFVQYVGQRPNYLPTGTGNKLEGQGPSLIGRTRTPKNINKNYPLLKLL